MFPRLFLKILQSLQILFGFQVQIDEVATREWYEKADEWNCECEDGFWHLCDDTENILYFISRINKYLN